MSWEKFTSITNRFFPSIRILHPPPCHRFDARTRGPRCPTSRSRARRRDVTRAKKVAVLDDIAGTCLDKGDEIDALGKLPEGDNTRPLIHTQPLPHILKTISPCSHRLSGELV